MQHSFFKEKEGMMVGVWMVYRKNKNKWMARQMGWLARGETFCSDINWVVLIFMRVPAVAFIYMYIVQVCRYHTSPGTVGGGDWRSALHSGDEGRLKIKQVTIQIGHTEEQNSTKGVKWRREWWTRKWENKRKERRRRVENVSERRRETKYRGMEKQMRESINI